MGNFILILLSIILFIKLSSNQSIPSVPCPDIFSYILNSKTNQIEGRISILDFRTESYNFLRIRMTYPPYVINNYSGEIIPVKRIEDISTDIQRRQPVMFKVIFPTIDPLPTLSEIIFNDAKICKYKKHQVGEGLIDLYYNISVSNINVIPNTYSSPAISNTIQVSNTNFVPLLAQPPNFQNSNVDKSFSCGESFSPIRLIVGGNTLQSGTWPWLAAMFKRTSDGRYDYACGSSIITPNAVLTAAHCVIDDRRISRPEDVLIGLGLFEIKKWNDPDTFMANAYNIITHPDYGNTNRYYDGDIAIIILDRSYPYNNRIRPICMWEGKSDVNKIVNEQGYVAGWGVSKVAGRTTELPNIVESEIVSIDTCRNSNSAIQDLIANRNFCAGYLNGQGPCKGDSGGGFMIEKGGKWYLRGIVSGALGHGTRTCNLNEYVIYTDVAKFRKWIRSYVNY